MKAINHQEIIDIVFGGASSQTSFIAWPWQGIPWPKPLSEMGDAYQYDPAGAQQLLDAAGVGEVSVPILFIGEITPGAGDPTGNPYVTIRAEGPEGGRHRA